MPDIFTAANLAKSIHASLDDATAAIPAGKKSAVLIDATNERVRMLLALKAGDNWTIAGEMAYDGDRVLGKVSVAGSWK
jgi:hypothetical protein